MTATNCNSSSWKKSCGKKSKGTPIGKNFALPYRVTVLKSLQSSQDSSQKSARQTHRFSVTSTEYELTSWHCRVFLHTLARTIALSLCPSLLLSPPRLPMTAETVVDRAMELDHIGGTFGGSRKPTAFIQLVLKVNARTSHSLTLYLNLSGSLSHTRTHTHTHTHTHSYYKSSLRRK